MFNYIEKAGQAIQIQEQKQKEIAQGSREIFTTAIDILRLKGKQGYLGDNPFSKYTYLSHSSNSAGQTVSVLIVAGHDLEKAKSVHIDINGINENLTVRRSIKKGHEFFNGELSPGSCVSIVPSYFTETYGSLIPSTPTKGPRKNLNLDGLKGFLGAIRQVKSELSV